jgi:hypothetical protein
MQVQILDQFGKRLFDASQILSKVRHLVGRTGQEMKMLRHEHENHKLKPALIVRRINGPSRILTTRAEPVAPKAPSATQPGIYGLLQLRPSSVT